MNSVQLIGRLTRDPEVRYTTGQNQTAVARFSIAVNDGYGENERTSFINIVVFGRQAENCERFLSKGRQVGITGRIQTGSYEKDGRTVYTTDVVANRVEFLGGGDNASRPAASGSYSRPQQQSAPAPSYGADSIEGFQSVDDDIPF
ncbi:MAG: single-stranded DNA-binding protein [Eubacterium sp.]|nr:single-stranded DNA-binding protein [Candidatus Colimonas fimequi]